MKTYKQIQNNVVTCQGTTPTYTFVLPKNVDLNIAESIYVTFSTFDDVDLFTKSETVGQEESIHIVEPNIVTVDLTQEETFMFPLEGVVMQLNWIYHVDAVIKRGASELVRIDVDENLLREVIE